MKQLTEWILTELDINKSTIKNVIAIYPGRFQPMGAHHAKTYDWLAKQFGKNNTYVATSDKTELPKSPFNFNEKKKIINSHGITNVVHTKNPYVAEEILKKYDPKTTAVVFMYGAKDAGRLRTTKKDGSPGYYQPYEKNKNNLAGYEQHGYFVIAPHVSMNVPGFGEMSGTEIRKALGGNTPNKEKIFKGIFGHTNKSIYNIVVPKLEKLLETVSNQNIMELLVTEAKPLDKKLSWTDKKTGEKKSGTARSVLQTGDDTHPAWDNATRLKQQDDKSREREADVKKQRDAAERDTEKEKTDTQDKQPEEKPKGSPLTATDFQLPQEQEPEADVSFTPSGDTPKDTKFAADATLLSKAKDGLKKLSDSEKQMFRKIPEQKRSIGEALLNKAKSIPKALKETFTHKVHVYKETAVATGKLLSGKSLDKHDKSALKQFAIDAAILSGMVASGGVGAGVAGFGQAIATNLATLWVKDISILGIGRAALFANKENLTEDELLTKATEHFATWLQTKKLTQDDYLQMLANYEPQVNETFSKEWWKTIVEEINLPVEIGDTVYMGKFKNKPIVVKDITWNEKGDLLINGKPALKMRLRVKTNESIDKKFLTEGGAYGHMNHPFDDSNLKFADIKKMIDLGLQGKLDVEQSVTEKTDGQNLMVTWKDGKLKAARNKSTLIDPMDITAVKSKFAGRGDIEKAFVYSMKDLQTAIGKLSDAQRDKIFKGGRAFMNLEIIYPATENVIVYDTAVIQFHGAIEYDTKGNIVGPVKDSGRILQGMIAQVNADVQKHFKIIKPQVLSIKPHNDYTSKRDYFFDKLKKLQKEFNLKDADTLGMYHQMWWESFIRKQANKTNYIVPNNVMEGLIRRWAFWDKGYSVGDMKRNIKDQKFLDWVITYDKTDHSSQVKDNMYPFETLIFEVGTEILKNVENYLSASPKRAMQKIKDEVRAVAKEIEKGGDIKKIDRLRKQLSRIEAAGGLNKVVPSEGLVFVYGGKTYKITGTFGPINQILGTLKFA